MNILTTKIKSKNYILPFLAINLFIILRCQRINFEYKMKKNSSFEEKKTKGQGLSDEKNTNEEGLLDEKTNCFKIHIFVENSQETLLKEYLTKQLNVNEINFKNREGKTPLHIAAKNNYASIAKLLLTYGAHLNSVDNSKQTSLHIAVQNRSLEVVKLLIENNVNLNPIDQDNKTPLDYVNKNSNIYRILKSIKGRRVMYGVEFKITSEYQLFINQKDTKTGFAPIHIASLNGNLEKVSFLLQHPEIDINLQTKKRKMTSLHIASRANNHRLIGLLLAKNANPRLKDIDGKVPHELVPTNSRIYKLLTSQFNKFEVCMENSENIKRYIKNKYNMQINENDEFGLSPIHIAAREGKLKDLAYILKSSINIDLQCKNKKNTPLHYAAEWNKIEAVNFLLDHGADKNIKNINNKIPYALAKNSEIKSMLSNGCLIM